ncbi:hypothetical protein D7V82_05020 [bacterium 1xD8-6]|nr:hypothetical protein D7V72_05700 [bacterium D16-36]RKI71931.1 hypothetical protein D7V82_05020 [bacterium 1xD8-6]
MKNVPEGASVHFFLRIISEKTCIILLDAIGGRVSPRKSIFSIYIHYCPKSICYHLQTMFNVAITPCYPSFSNVPASGCVSVFALTEYDTPKKEGQDMPSDNNGFPEELCLAGL